jgi:hypothetical protein
MYKNIKLANSEFVGFTMARLDKRYDLLTDIIQDPDALDWEIEDAARKRREVRECINVFIEEDVDDPTATVAMILEVVTGQSIEKLQKQTIGGEIAQDMLDRTAAATRATGQATKKSLNGFAKWLAGKTE